MLQTAVRVLQRVTEMEERIAQVHYAYVDFDKYLRRGGVEAGGMTAAARASFDGEVQAFLVRCTASLKEFKRVAAGSEHYMQVSLFLLDRLHGVSGAFTRMKKQQRQYDVDPIKLLTVMEGREDGKFRDVVSSSSASSHKHAQAEAKRASAKDKKAPGGTDASGASVPPDFADRYVSEVASSSKLKEYDAIATSHRSKYLNETRDLRKKFSQEAEEALNIGRNISDISETFTEFLAILASQQEDVQEIHDAAKVAADEVGETERELALTLERSKSHNMTMISLYIILGLIVLFFDLISP
jgi:hypothetical protein